MVRSCVYVNGQDRKTPDLYRNVNAAAVLFPLISSHFFFNKAPPRVPKPQCGVPPAAISSVSGYGSLYNQHEQRAIGFEPLIIEQHAAASRVFADLCEASVLHTIVCWKAEPQEHQAHVAFNFAFQEQPTGRGLSSTDTPISIQPTHTTRRGVILQGFSLSIFNKSWSLITESGPLIPGGGTSVESHDTFILYLVFHRVSCSRLFSSTVFERCFKRISLFTLTSNKSFVFLLSCYCCEILPPKQTATR